MAQVYPQSQPGYGPQPGYAPQPGYGQQHQGYGQQQPGYGQQNSFPQQQTGYAQPQQGQMHPPVVPQQPVGYGAPPAQNQPGGRQPVQWMPIPQGLSDCPAGLEYLTQIDQLLVHQQVEILERESSINNK